MSETREPHDMDDDELSSALARVIGDADPVPDTVREAARAAFGWRRIDAELAELVRDTVDDDVLAGARGAATTRLLTFAAGDVELEVEVVDGDPPMLVGQLIGPTGGGVVLESVAGESVDVEVDDLGSFEVAVATGTVRLRRVGGTGGGIVTPWFDL